MNVLGQFPDDPPPASTTFLGCVWVSLSEHSRQARRLRGLEIGLRSLKFAIQARAIKPDSAFSFRSTEVPSRTTIPSRPRSRRVAVKLEGSYRNGPHGRGYESKQLVSWRLRFMTWQYSQGWPMGSTRTPEMIKSPGLLRTRGAPVC